MKNKPVKNNFVELQNECSEMWNERKGIDHAGNKKQVATHFSRVKKHIANIKALIEKIETEECVFIENFYLKND